MNSKNKAILESIFKEPVKADVHWSDIEKLFAALGAEISEGSGSRIRVALNGRRAVFHCPHPERITDKGQLKSVRKFLESAGIRK